MTSYKLDCLLCILLIIRVLCTRDRKHGITEFVIPISYEYRVLHVSSTCIPTTISKYKMSKFWISLITCLWYTYEYIICKTRDKKGLSEDWPNLSIHRNFFKIINVKSTMLSDHVNPVNLSTNARGSLEHWNVLQYVGEKWLLKSDNCCPHTDMSWTPYQFSSLLMILKL